MKWQPEPKTKVVFPDYQMRASSIGFKNIVGEQRRAFSKKPGRKFESVEINDEKKLHSFSMMVKGKIQRAK